MTAYNLFKEYIWLVKTIHRYRRISLKDINMLWRETDMSGGVEFSRATFNRHKDAIQDIFGLYIECDRRDNAYYIGNSHVLEEDSVQNWLLSTLSVNNIISEGLSLQDRIQIESIPAETFLADIMEAMKKGRKLEMVYRRFGMESKTHILAPYALKVYQKRWYLLAFFEARIDEEGREHHAHFAIFSLDRIEKVRMLRDAFRMPKDFSVKDFFAECYGIVTGDEIATETVILRAYGREAYNMRSLPLHHSQREMGKVQRVEEVKSVESGGMEYTDFVLRLKPTLDFQGKILSRGAWVEVMEPQWLRDKIADTLRKSLERYAPVEEDQ